MPECRRKISPASAFLMVVSCLSHATAFRHQGSVRYRWSRISPALPSYVNAKVSSLRHINDMLLIKNFTLSSPLEIDMLVKGLWPDTFSRQYTYNSQVSDRFKSAICFRLDSFDKIIFIYPQFHYNIRQRTDELIAY
jgi:hypothetical protein